MEFGASGIKLLTQYRLDDELVEIDRNALCGERLPAVLVFQTANDVPVVGMVLDRAEGWKGIVGLEDIKDQYKGSNDESLSIHLPACCLDHFFQQWEVELGLFADIERMSLEEGPPCHFCTPKGFIVVNVLKLQIVCEQIFVGCWR